MSRNKIFISFRNKDGDVLAAHLDALLRKEYGDEHIFRSGRSIKPGAVFDRVILDALDRTLVMLVIIGPGWAGEAEGGGRRIDRPEDWVRKEVSYGLAAEGVTVIPVLLNGTPLPDVATLPDDLKGITTRQTVPFRSKFAHIDWIPLIERLRDIHGIGKVPPHPGPAVLPPRVSRRLDLQVLDDLLSTRRWEEADRESARMLYAAAGGDPDTSRAHLIRYDQIDDIAPEDLDAIDRLWRHYSDGRFGLTAQLNALRQAQGDLRAFAREIGWYTDRWIFYAEARFKTSAPVGHLPILGPVGGVRPPWRFRYLRDGTMGVLRMPVELTKYLSDRETVQRVHDRPVDESLGWTEYSRMVSHATFEVVADAFKGRARTLRKLYTEAPARRMVSYYTQLISVVWAITRVRLLDRLD